MVNALKPALSLSFYRKRGHRATTTEHVDISDQAVLLKQWLLTYRGCPGGRPSVLAVLEDVGNRANTEPDDVVALAGAENCRGP